MGKIGFNCQLLLSEIGLTTEKKIFFFSMFYSILVGEEPDSVLLKKRGSRTSQDDMDHPLFLRQRSYHFRRNWSYISFQFPFQSSYSYVFPRHFIFRGLKSKKKRNGQIPFLRNTYKKKDNGNPTINYFIFIY